MKSFTVGTKGKGLVLQERDRHLLRELGTMRLIDREQAKIVAGFGSTTRANTRLLALARAHLLTRFFMGTSGGGQKALYSLSRMGANLVEITYRSPRRHLDEVITTDSFVHHQMAINQVYCAFKYQPFLVRGVEFVRWLTFRQPLEAGARLIPDGYCEVKSPREILASFVEVDLGNEGFAIWKQKVQAYLRYAVSGNFESHFQRPRFRVLVIVNSERRLQAIRRVVAGLTDKIFWFSTLDSIAEHGVWSEIWLRPRGDEKHMLLHP